MANLVGTSWGETPGLRGDAGGVVTWSIAGGGLGLNAFGGGGRSVDPDTFLTIDYEAIIRQAMVDWSSFGKPFQS